MNKILSVVALGVSTLFLQCLDIHAGNRGDYNLVPKCTESDGRFRWEVINKTAATPSYSIYPTDNGGTTAAGSAFATGAGDGDGPDRTRAHTSKPSSAGGINFELLIDGFKYRKNANTSACPTAVTKVDLCHIPPGNPQNAHMISVGHPAYAAHEAHGDTPGPCPEVNPCHYKETMSECASRGIVH